MQVLIVDDHPLFRHGLKALLQTLDRQVETADAGSLPEVQALHAQGLQPELVLLDMNLPGLNRLDALQAVRALWDAACIVVVSAEEDPVLIRATIDAGAAGYIPKTTDTAVTIQALRLALAHGIYLPQIALRASPERRLRAQAPRLADFTPKQQAVLKTLLQGKSNKVIARELGIAEGTVKAHLWAVYQILDVSSRTQAMYVAHELGLLELPHPP